MWCNRLKVNENRFIHHNISVSLFSLLYHGIKCLVLIQELKEKLMASNDISHPSPPAPIDPVIQITLPVSTKLTRDNFLTWQSQIEPILHGFGLTKFVNASVLPPNKNSLIDGVSSTNPAFSAWYKQDRFLLGWFRTTITEGILS